MDSETTDDALLTAPARPFSVILAEQLDTIAEVNPAALDSPTLQSLADLRRQLAEVAAGASYERIFGDMASYMRSLEELDPIAEARGIRRPLLNLHGERDYQVRMQNFASWQAAFGDQPQVTMRSYPRLNHFFMAQGDLSRMGIAQDYAIPDSLAEAVIDDIAGWIGSQGRGA